MERFVCVRMTRTNELDLSVFQFDADLTFAVFFLNADRTLYGRYGTRSAIREAERDVSIEGLRKAMQAALELHGNYPANKASLAGKLGPKPTYKTLADSAWIQTRPFAKDKSRCTHCHMIRTAERMTVRMAGKPMPDDLLFPWPMPRVVGLALDPKEKATVKWVLPGSAAAKAGLLAGDEIVTFEGQAILSTADVQWVLHRAGETAKLRAEVLREGSKRDVTLVLEKGWRRKADISWRATTFMLRGLVFGGMFLEELSAAERQQAGLQPTALALRVTRKLRPVQPATQAGFRQGDVLVAYKGQTRRMSATELLAYGLRNTVTDEKVPITILRGGRRITLRLPMR